jgi:hypothetical protein
LLTLSTDTGDDHEEDGGADDDEEAPRAVGDPYSNLDGAFGNYMADQPRPMTANNHGKTEDDDDLLF